MMITNEDNAQLKRHYSKSGNKAISRGKIDTWECLSCAGVSDIPAVSGGEERVREETTPIHVKGIKIRVLQTEVLTIHTEIKYVLEVLHIIEAMPRIFSG